MSNTESVKNTKIPKSAKIPKIPKSPKIPKIVSKKNCKNDNSDPKPSLDNECPLDYEKFNVIFNFAQTTHPTKLEELMNELRSIRKVYDTDPKKFFQLLEGVIDRHDKAKALEKNEN